MSQDRNGGRIMPGIAICFIALGIIGSFLIIRSGWEKPKQQAKQVVTHYENYTIDIEDGTIVYHKSIDLKV